MVHWVENEQTNMLIDDFNTGRKRGEKLNVTPPSQKTLRLDETEVTAGTDEWGNEQRITTVEPVAASNQDTNTAERAKSGESPESSTPKKRFKLSKKLVIIASVASVIVLGSGGAAAYAIFHKKSTPGPVASATPTPSPTPTEPPKPTTVASKLSGAQITPALNDRRVTAILIENSPDARPQSGLLEAGVIFEAIAEGGITRFLALYQEGTPDYIGPVRSVRPYYLDFFAPFDAAVAHVGGSLDALQQLKSEGLKDLDQFHNSGAYQRISSRYAPHNVYTSTANLDALQDAKGYKTSEFTPWPRKEPAPAATPTASSIAFNISSFLYNPHFDWDRGTNRYTRNQAGKPHSDERTGLYLTPTTVVAMVMGFDTVRASDGYRSEYKTTGSGTAYVFQDGNVTKGSWSKADRKSMFKFTNAEGQPIALNPGQTWISIVDEESSIGFK